MHKSGLSRWVVRGVLVSAACAASACGWLPQQPGNDSFQPGFARAPDVHLSNGTIEQNPTSIDPRTPALEGTANRSLMMDRGQEAMLTPIMREEGVGGSGPAPLPGQPSYEALGAAGSVIAPSNQLPASMRTPMNGGEPVGERAGGFLRKY